MLDWPDHPPVSGRKAEASAETRAALLEAGARLVREQPVGAILSQVTARAVAERAGRTAGAFFHQWENQEAYHRDLLEYVLDPARIASTNEAVRAVVAGLRAGTTDPETVLRQAARNNFDSVRADPYVPLWFALWGRHGQDPEIHDLLRTHYQSVTSRLAPLVELLLSAMGRRMRPPYTVEHFTVLSTALVQGLALRQAVEPERVPVDPPTSDRTDRSNTWDLFSDALTHLFFALSEE